MSGVNGGNPDLGPEEAATSTLGVVWTSRFSHALVSNLQVSLDWYRIEIDRQDRASFHRGPVLQYCYDARYNPDFSPTNQWCTMFERDSVDRRDRELPRARSECVQLGDEWNRHASRLALRPRPGQVGVNWFVSWLDELTSAVVDSSAPVDRVARERSPEVVGPPCRNGNPTCT